MACLSKLEFTCKTIVYHKFVFFPSSGPSSKDCFKEFEALKGSPLPGGSGVSLEVEDVGDEYVVKLSALTKTLRDLESTGDNTPVHLVTQNDSQQEFTDYNTLVTSATEYDNQQVERADSTQFHVVSNGGNYQQAVDNTPVSIVNTESDSHQVTTDCTITQALPERVDFNTGKYIAQSSNTAHENVFPAC